MTLATGVEVRTRTGWRPLARGAEAPTILETDRVALRGLEPGVEVRIGPRLVEADADGHVEVRPASDDDLRGHVGLITIFVGGWAGGEIEVVPHKLSESAYALLRAELERTWANLTVDLDGVAAVAAGVPGARELWRRIDEPLTQILEQPNEHLGVGVVIRRMEHARHRRELAPRMVKAGYRGAAALTRTLQRTTDTPENHLAGATLRLLQNHARTDPMAGDVVQRIDKLLRHPVLARSHEPVCRITWGMRKDRRYRQILAVHQLLNRPELAATEGAGEHRIGVRALPRLYEYWVFLQVLLAAAERYGPPIDAGAGAGVGSGFGALAVAVAARAGDGPARYRRWTEIPAGTTVTFPGPVHVAFEPRITARGDGWMGLEYVPHPDLERQQMIATPDVVVFRSGGAPWLTVIDAKYVGRHFVEHEAARVHDKYARMRWQGVPVVRNVLVAHPHTGLAQQWAGYGHVALTPGEPVPSLPLPLPVPVPVPVDEPVDHPDAGIAPPVTPPTGAPPTRPTVSERQISSPSLAGLEQPEQPDRIEEFEAVVIDQYWMHRWLRSKRIEIGAMRHVVAGGRPVGHFEIVLPRIWQLESFAWVAERHGWTVQWVESPNRIDQVDVLVELITGHLEAGPVLVVSGDPEVLACLPRGQIEIVDDLTDVPLL